MWVTAGVLVFLSVASPASAQNTRIFSSSNSALGAGLFRQAPRINAAGEMVFSLDWRVGTGLASQQRIYRVDPTGGLFEVARTTPNVTDAIEFESFSKLWLNDQNQVMFRSTLTSGEEALTFSPGTNTPVNEVARTNSGATLASSAILDINGASLSDTGVATFKARFDSDTQTLFDPLLDRIYASNQGGSLQRIDSVSVGGTTIGSPIINQTGRIAFRAQTSAAVPNDEIRVGMIGEPVTAAVDADTEVFGTNLETIANLAINDAGDLAFRSTAITLNEDGDITNQRPGHVLIEADGTGRFYFPVNGGQLRGGASFADSFNQIGRPSLNNHQAIGFRADLNNSVLGDRDDSGLFVSSFQSPTQPEGSLLPIVQENDLTPDGDRRFAEFSNPTLLDSGALGFFAGLRDKDAITEAFTDQGIYLADGLDTVTVAETGDTRGNWEIVQLDLVTGPDGGGQVSINQKGQVAYKAREVNQFNSDEIRDTLYQFTPELHWREENSGDWAEEDNWTLGLDPAWVHHTFIDPLASLSVSGSESNMAVKSLTLGARSIGATATLALDHPSSLTVGQTLNIESGGAIQQLQGDVRAEAFNNDGNYLQQTAGSLHTGSLVNRGRMDLFGTTWITGEGFGSDDTILSGSARNTGRMYIGPEAKVQLADGIERSGQPLVNRGELTLDRGTIQGDVMNYFAAEASLQGRIAGNFQNLGTLEVPGDLVVGGRVENLGQVTLATQEMIRSDLDALNGGGYGGGELEGPIDLNRLRWRNQGRITLAGGLIEPAVALDNEPGGMIQGYGTINPGSPVDGLVNDGGIIHANQADQRLLATTFGGNMAGGKIIVEDHATFQSLISAAPPEEDVDGFVNDGEIDLRGPDARFVADEMLNRGTLHGQGRFQSELTNRGVVRAEDGRLELAGRFNSNGPGFTGAGAGRIEVLNGAEVFVSRGLGVNDGQIQLQGGTFDNNARSLQNSSAGVIGGHGTLRAAEVTNAGLMTFADQDTDLFTNIVNDGRFEVTNNMTRVFGNVTNNTGGSITVNEGTLRVFGDLVNNGALVTDPTVVQVASLINGQDGYIVADPGDQFIIEQDLLSDSTQASKWLTDDAMLRFAGGSGHVLELTGEDLGATFSGLQDNFAWGQLSLAEGEHLFLTESDGDGSGALYIRELLLDGGLNQLTRVESNGLNIYYDPDRAGNDYLNADTYNLNGGGLLQPIPEPATVAMLTLAVGAVMLGRRRVRAVDRQSV